MKLKKIKKELCYFIDGKKVEGNCSDLTGDCSGLSGNCSGLSGNCSGITGNCTNIYGNCTNLEGDCSNLEGDCSGLSGNCSDLSGDCSKLSGDCSGIKGNCTDISGDLDKAIANYELLISEKDWGWEAQEYWIHAHYQLGKIFEDKEDVQKAINYYQRYLDILKDADPGLPEVEDAKNKLAALKTK